MQDYIKIEINDRQFPDKLKKIKNPPKKLYISGNYNLLNHVSIAIVGSRDCTGYGFKTAYEFAKELSKKEICIISGLAEGIDTAAHLGGMHQIGRTIAVIGSGFNRIFPEENEILAKSIIKNEGLVITEYDVSEESKSENFPKRNRIMTALADAVLIIEAKKRSGTLITARLAKEQNKKIFCLPGNSDSKNSSGTNKLIKEGSVLVTHPNDILNEMDQELEDVIKDEYKSVYNVLNKNSPIHINEICKMARISMPETSQILTMLEIEGLIKSLPNNEFIKE